MNEDKLPILKWPQSLLSGGSVMGRVILEHDWSQSVLGPLENWPQEVATTLTTALGSQFPRLILLGPNFICLFNDGYASILGEKKDTSLGAMLKEVWPEAWDSLYGMLKEVLATGKGSWAEDQIYFSNRNGYSEESYFTFSFGRILDEKKGKDGISCSAIETTAKVLANRRLKTLQEISNQSTDKINVEEAGLACVAALSTNSSDLPFFSLYWRNPDSKKAKSIGSNHVVVPEYLNIDHPLLAEAFQSKLPVLIDNVSNDLHVLPVPAGRNTPNSVYVMPIRFAFKEEVSGFLIIGLSPHQPFTDEYKSFLNLVIVQIQTVMTSALAQDNARIIAAELAKIDLAKTAFFSNISHEFRTPLTLLMGPLEEALLHIENGKASLNVSDLESAHRNALRLLKLVNSLLDFSRVEAGRVDVNFESTNLSIYTKELVAQFETVFERGGISLEVKMEPLNGLVNIDRELWEKILFNLLSNAFKFTFQGKVVVSLFERDEFIHLTVRDSGTGIPEGEISKIFQRFHRVQGSLSRSFEGSGIGLALVQEMTKLHGGVVTCESIYGKGSIFDVSLPKDRSRSTSDKVSSTNIVPSLRHTTAAFLSEANLWLDDSMLVSSPLPGVHPEHKSVVLIIDDNPDMRAYLARILRDTYFIETAKNGIDALTVISRRLPHLIITDVMMPEMDGFGLLKKLRSNEKTRLLPVIMLSARAGDDATVEGLEAGADEYLIKPFSPRELLARVRSLLSMSNLRRDLESERKTISSLAEVQRLSLLLDASPDHVFMLDRNGRYVYHNKAACETLAAHLKTIGREGEKIIGKTFRDIGLGNDFLIQFEAHLEEALKGSPVAGEALFSSPTGPRLFEYILSPAPQEETGTQYVIGISRDVNELKIAVKARDEFITIASHELKTPLTSLLMLAQLQMKLIERNDPAAFSENRVKYLSSETEKQVLKLSTLVEDMLEISRLKSGKYNSKTERLDLVTLVQDVLDRMSPQFISSGCGAPIFKAPRPVFGKWNSMRIEQVLNNLLVNAIKYGNGTRVSITVDSADGVAKVSVNDQGNGIPVGDQLRIFKRFERAISADEVSGLGLGLFISQQIIESFNGRIWVNSENGNGSTFYFELPLNL